MSAPARARSPWQRLYEAAHRRRVAYWSVRAERLPIPVWSVGNLHWGGTGKTPVVTAIAAWLSDRGVRVAVLSRGYGRRGSGPLVVSTGEGPLVTPERAGDEPWMLAEALPGVAVAVGERRSEAARLLLAILREPPQLFLLDDGFSHLRLARDLDLLVLPAGDPFGGGRLAPSGRLREPLAAAARARALLLAGADVDATRAREVAAALSPFRFTGSAFACDVRSAGARRITSGEATTAMRDAARRAAAPPAAAGADAGVAASASADDTHAQPAMAPLLLVTGIARPERVRAAAEAAGLRITDHLAFRDHHRYPPRSLHRIEQAAARAGAAGVLTTAKDRVKLAGRLSLPLWELPVVAAPEAAFWSWLEARLPGAGAV